VRSTAAGGANVTSLLRHHLRAGNIKRVSREVFAAVPAHLAVERMVIDRFAAASKLRSDGVLGFTQPLSVSSDCGPRARGIGSAHDRTPRTNSGWSLANARNNLLTNGSV
jgi:hypothetical protein